MELDFVMGIFSMTCSLLAFIIGFLLTIHTLYIVSNNESRDFDYDFACHLIDAPMIPVILIILVNYNGISLTIKTGQSFAANELYKENCLVRNEIIVEKSAFCGEILSEAKGCMTSNHMQVLSSYQKD